VRSVEQVFAGMRPLVETLAQRCGEQFLQNRPVLQRGQAAQVAAVAVQDIEGDV
jgi:hypothetical protein